MTSDGRFHEVRTSSISTRGVRRPLPGNTVRCRGLEPRSAIWKTAALPDELTPQVGNAVTRERPRYLLLEALASSERPQLPARQQHSLVVDTRIELVFPD